MRYFLTLLCLCWAQLAGAVSFDEHTRQLPLGHEIAVFEDVRGNTALTDITSAALEPSFRRHDKDVLNAGYSRSVFWLRLDLEYQPTQGRDSREFLLELAYPPLDQLDLYVPDLWGGLQRVAQTGDALPFATRVIQQNNYVFPLQFQAGERKRIYLRLQSQGSIQAPLNLWSTQAYLEAQPGRIYVLGIIYGVLLVMLVYNLFIYISVRDTSYLYYILYIASFGLYQVSVNGAGVQYFWPDSPWWANAATPFLIGSAALFGCQFARSFLHTAEHSPWVDRILRVMMFAGGLVMLLSLVASYALALRLATLLALVFTLVIFSAGLISWSRGMRVARYFIFAWSAFLIGGLVNTLIDDLPVRCDLSFSVNLDKVVIAGPGSRVSGKVRSGAGLCWADTGMDPERVAVPAMTGSAVTGANGTSAWLVPTARPQGERLVQMTIDRSGKLTAKVLEAGAQILPAAIGQTSIELQM